MFSLGNGKIQFNRPNFIPYFIGILLFVNFLTSSNILSLLATILSVCYIFVCREDNIVPFGMFTAPFAYLFVYSRFNLYFIVAISITLRLAILEPKRFRYFLILPMFLLTHMITTSWNLLSIGMLTPTILLLTLLVCSDKMMNSDSSKTFSCYLKGFFVASILGFFKDNTRIVEILDADYISYTNLSFNRFSGLSPDCNFYTILAITAISIYLFRGKEKSIKDIIGLLISIVLGLLTLSKSFVLCVIVELMIYFLISDLKSKKYIVTLFVVAIIAFIIFNNQISLYLNAIIFRFEGARGDFSNFTSGRSNLWDVYWKEIISSGQNLLFGTGFTHIVGKNYAHNTFLNIIYQFGFVGFLTDSIFVLWASRTCIGTPKPKLFGYIPLLAILMLLFNLSAYSFYSLWVCFLLSFLLAKDSKEMLFNENRYNDGI